MDYSLVIVKKIGSDYLDVVIIFSESFQCCSLENCVCLIKDAGLKLSTHKRNFVCEEVE